MRGGQNVKWHFVKYSKKNLIEIVVKTTYGKYLRIKILKN
jgi:hypothetical protein